MRWAKSTAFPIVLISLVIGGYTLTVNHMVGAERDAKFSELFDEFTKLKSDLLKANIEGIPLTINQPVAVGKNLPRSVQSELALLRKELNEIRGQQKRYQQALDNLAYTGDSGDDANEFSESTEIDNESIAETETIEVESSFEAEHVDPDWEASAELEIDSAIAERSIEGVSFTNTECRSTLCRIEVEFDDAKAQLEQTPFLPMLIPWSGESYIQTDPTGDGKAAVLYVARAGYSLSGEMTEGEKISHIVSSENR